MDNRKFWKNIKPVFSNKVKTVDYIDLKENNTLITNNDRIANIFKEDFVNIVPNLAINVNNELLC